MLSYISPTQDILDINTLSENLNEIITEVLDNHADKIIIKDNKPAALLINVEDYQALYDRVLALELEIELLLTLEAEEKGELDDWDEVTAKLGLQQIRFDTPEEYERYIEEVENAS